MVKLISYESKRRAALRKPLTLVVIAVLASALIYSSSSASLVFGKKTVTEISCYPQDGKTRCCGSEVDDHLVYGYTGVTYCTTCDNTSPPSNCSPREKIERQQPTTTTTNMCPANTALDRNGNCAPLTQGPTGIDCTANPNDPSCKPTTLTPLVDCTKKPDDPLCKPIGINPPSSTNDNKPSKPKLPNGNTIGELPQSGEELTAKKKNNKDNSPTPPPCPTDNSPIPPNCTLKPKF
jgi:hypothetical protein